ncbi:MAG: CynX/NimT family MFS transporter [Chloroflexota bacterium]
MTDSRAAAALPVLAAAWFAAFNLRTGFIGVGPLIPDLKTDLGLTATAASTLVAIPTLMMGLVSVFGGAMADRLGAARTIALGLLLVALGGGLRAASHALPPLVFWTVLFGTGIGIAQPALPRLTRGLFPARLGLATGIYASGLVTGSILAGSLTIPLETRLAPAAGWRGPLIFWSVVAAIALALWLVVSRGLIREDRAAGNRPAAAGPAADLDPAAAAWNPWRDRRAWVIAVIAAGQGLAYYLLIAWMPSVYRDLGVGPGMSSALFVVYNFATLPAILLFPIVSDRLGSRKIPCIVASCCLIAGSLGLVLAPTAFPLAWAWPYLGGTGVAALFAMSLVLPADVAPALRVGAAAGMTLAIGYLGSAIGPVLAGLIKDATGGFGGALRTIPVVGLTMLVFSLFAPERPRSRHA